MKASVKPIPDGYSAPVPSLVVDGAAAAIDYYKKAFGAKETGRMPTPDGKKIMHADLAIGDGHIMLNDELPGMGKSPKSLGGTPVTISIWVEDVDKVVERAAAAGGTTVQPVHDEFWGDRAGLIRDPFGHNWYILTRKENVSREEMQKRMSALPEMSKA